MNGQEYCTIAELYGDLDLPGLKDEAKAMKFVRAASQWLSKRGEFIPVTATRRFDGPGLTTLWIDPIVAVTTLVHDGATLATTDYILYPRNRLWTNGPYYQVELASRGNWTWLPDTIVITGRWGLYDEQRATTARATQLASETTLSVDNAAEISPGAVVMLDSEQEAVESTGTPIDSGAKVDATTITLDTATEIFDVDDPTLLHVGEIIRVGFEQMKVLDMLDETLLVMRGYNGTTRASHADDTAIYVYRTFNVTRGVNGTTAADHMTDTVYRAVPPDDVNYLTRQIAALMLKKAEGGFAGKIGNAELGEVFYNNEFPKATLDTVLNNYRVVTI